MSRLRTSDFTKSISLKNKYEVEKSLELIFFIRLSVFLISSVPLEGAFFIS